MYGDTLILYGSYKGFVTIPSPSHHKKLLHVSWLNNKTKKIDALCELLFLAGVLDTEEVNMSIFPVDCK